MGLWQRLYAWLFPPRDIYAVMVQQPRPGAPTLMVGPRVMTRRQALEWFIDVAEEHWGSVARLVVKRGSRWVTA